MENSWFCIALGTVALVAFLSKLYTNKQLVKKNPPPGPKPWPIIGNLHLLVGNNHPHRVLDRLSKKYGEIMLLKFGSRPVVVASSPDMAEQFLRVHDSNFASRPVTAAGKYTGYNRSNVVWAPYGPYWRQARRIYFSEIFSAKRLESFEYIWSEERRAFFSSLYGLRGKPVVLKEHLSRYTLTSFSRMVLSNRYFADSNAGDSTMRIEELQHLIDKWIWLNGAFIVGDWIPWLGPFDLQGYIRHMKDLAGKMDKFLNFVIDDHKVKMEAADENFVPKDMLDVLLQLAEDPNLAIKLDGGCIKGLMQDLLTGGGDTSATAVEWAVNELVKNPQCISKATEELDRVIGRERWVEESDISQLTYLDGIIKETLRLHPLAMMLVPHYAVEDRKVAGYDVAKGTTVLVNIWGIGRNPKFWDSPEKFLPERFYGKDVELNGRNYTLMPFGSGRRRCPGYNLGLKLVRRSLANLLHGFSWKLPGGMRPEDVSVEEAYKLSSPPKVPLAIVMEPRLAGHLY